LIIKKSSRHSSGLDTREGIMETPRKIYDQWNTMNQSALKRMKNSTPATVEHYRTNPPDYGRPAYFGIAVHAAVFEPEDFNKDYVVEPNFDGRPKNKTAKNGGCKEEWDAWKLEHEGRNTLTHEEFQSVLGMLGAIEKQPAARAILSSGAAERSFKEVVNGVECKGRLDWIFPESNINGLEAKGESYMDLKTTSKNFSPAEIDRLLYQNQIYFQAAFYHELYLRATDKAFVRHIMLIVSTEAPYLVQPYELSDDAIKKGRREVMEYLSAWSEWERTSVTKRKVGYSDGILKADLPAWAV